MNYQENKLSITGVEKKEFEHEMTMVSHMFKKEVLENQLKSSYSNYLEIPKNAGKCTHLDDIHLQNNQYISSVNENMSVVPLWISNIDKIEKHHASNMNIENRSLIHFEKANIKNATYKKSRIGCYTELSFYWNPEKSEINSMPMCQISNSINKFKVRKINLESGEKKYVKLDTNQFNDFGNICKLQFDNIRIPSNLNIEYSRLLEVEKSFEKMNIKEAKINAKLPLFDSCQMNLNNKLNYKISELFNQSLIHVDIASDYILSCIDIEKFKQFNIKKSNLTSIKNTQEKINIQKILFGDIIEQYDATLVKKLSHKLNLQSMYNKIDIQIEGMNLYHSIDVGEVSIEKNSLKFNDIIEYNSIPEIEYTNFKSENHIEQLEKINHDEVKTLLNDFLMLL